MYQWKQIPILNSLENKLKKHEEEFINSLADIITKTIMSSLPSMNLDEVESIIRKIKADPSLISSFCQSPKSPSKDF